MPATPGPTGIASIASATPCSISPSGSGLCAASLSIRLWTRLGSPVLRQHSQAAAKTRTCLLWPARVTGLRV